MTAEGPRPRLGWIVLVALLAAIVRLPFLGRPLSSDEGGYLMVAAQWHPGSSLYGSYWVDRPPLLVALFGLADLAGGTVALRLLGVAVAVASVLLAAWIGRLATPRSSAPLYAAVTAAVFVSTPLFDAQEVDGELLALPFLLAGTGCVLTALVGRTRRPGWWWLAAGALAAAAALVKQDMLDVVVIATVALVHRLVRPAAGRSRRTALGESMRDGALFALGAAVLGSAMLALAAARGTSPVGLWHALVVFRLHASQVLAGSGNGHVSRLLELLGVFALSGAPFLVIGLLAVSVRRHRGPGSEPVPAVPEPAVPVALLAAAALAWEAVGIVGGGSFWWHYQVQTITGLVLAAAALAGAGAAVRRGLRVALGYAAAVVVVATGLAPTWSVGPAADPGVVHYLRTHAEPGDTGSVAFGDPAILRAAGLQSPYPQLWSLPVRVRDPRLQHFTRVLRSPQRPTWIVTFGARLGTWGVDASSAERVLAQRYTKVAAPANFTIFEADTALARGTAAQPSPAAR